MRKHVFVVNKEKYILILLQLSVIGVLFNDIKVTFAKDAVENSN